MPDRCRREMISLTGGRGQVGQCHQQTEEDLAQARVRDGSRGGQKKENRHPTKNPLDDDHSEGQPTDPPDPGSSL